MKKKRFLETKIVSILHQQEAGKSEGYSAGYLADHWCTKGHIVHCLGGEFVSELQNGDSFNLGSGMSYIVSDELSSHRSHTTTGVKLLIIDGTFLKHL